MLIILALVAVGVTISIIFFPGPEYLAYYTQPAGYTVTTRCVTGGNDCYKHTYIDGLLVNLWDNLEKTKSSFQVHPDSGSCIATKSSTVDTMTYWWIDCGLTSNSHTPVIEGWVQEENLEFGEWVDSKVIETSNYGLR